MVGTRIGFRGRTGTVLDERDGAYRMIRVRFDGSQNTVWIDRTFVIIIDH